MRFLSSNLHEKLCVLLFHNRATPLSCGKTPAEIILGENEIDLLKPGTRGIFKAHPQYLGKLFTVGSRIQ